MVCLSLEESCGVGLVRFPVDMFHLDSMKRVDQILVTSVCDRCAWRFSATHGAALPGKIIMNDGLPYGLRRVAKRSSKRLRRQHR